MVVRYGWLIAVWLIIFAALVVLYRRGGLRKKQVTHDTQLVAHSERLRRLPEYKHSLARYRKRLIIVIVALTVCMAATVVLTLRPSVQSVVTPAETSRDIALCLDISGSVRGADVELLTQFEKLASDFDGQRIGLTIFDANSVQVFPLTDDYTLIKEQLAIAKKALAVNPLLRTVSEAERTSYANFISGTGSYNLKLNGKSVNMPNSNIGLGITTCVKSLGDNHQNRSRSLILATDNEAGVGALITTSQALMTAKERGIRVYAIDPGVLNYATDMPDPNMDDNYKSEHRVLRTYAALSGGNYYRLHDSNAMVDIIQRISTQEASLFVGDSSYALTDAPLVGITILLIGVVVAGVITWRLRL